MRSTVSLENVNALLEGRLERPTEVLGPQTVQHQGRKMLAVRAFLPEMRQAWLLDPKGIALPQSSVFAMFMVTFLVVAAVVALLGEETRGRALEELARESAGRPGGLSGRGPSADRRGVAGRGRPRACPRRNSSG